MKLLRLVLAALAALVLPATASADPADIDAAARGVVRVVLIDSDNDEVFPISHGTGFAVTSTKVITNAHVIREALQDDALRIGIVPSQGEAAAFARALAVSPRNDLALLEIIEGDLRLAPLTLSAQLSPDMSEVTSVGYPMNVDRAQGLEIADIFSAQPPVKSRGFLSGARPSRQFDTILHTAPIARGSSGGPLLDGCGRVVGVNSFGADSDGSDAEFYFAVSMREVLPFLREKEVEPRLSGAPCRSIEELDASEARRISQEREEARSRLAVLEAEQARKRERAELEAQFAVLEMREGRLVLALLCLLGGGVVGLFAFRAWRAPGRERGGESGAEGHKRALTLTGFGAALSIAGLLIWLSRPGLDAFDRLVEEAMQAQEDSSEGAGASTDASAGTAAPGEGMLLCTFLPERSRVTGAQVDDVEFEWASDGCVNTRTQYGFKDDVWSRIFVPNNEDAVAINSYDPQSRTFTTDRYLLGRDAMTKAREARSSYDAPKCGSAEASRKLGEQQSAVLAQLPARPNERLVYRCEAKGE